MLRRSSLLLCLLTLAMFACKDGEKDPAVEFKATGDTELDYLSKQISENSLDPQLRFQRAQVLYERNKLDESIEDLRVAILMDSMQVDYYHLLADAFMDNNVSSKSLQTMKVAAKLFPKRIPTLLKLCETHYILEQHNESIGVINEIIRLDPQNAEAYFMLGLNFRSLGDEKRAINALQTATEFDAKLIDAWIVLSEILEKNNSTKAREYLETAVRINPDNVFALHSYAYFLQNHNEVQRAKALYRKINGIDRNYYEAYLNHGILQLEDDSLAAAYEQFNILTGVDPLNPIGYFYKGYTLYAQGQPKAAVIELENAVSLDPNYQKAQDLLQEIKTHEKL